MSNENMLKYFPYLKFILHLFIFALAQHCILMQKAPHYFFVLPLYYITATIYVKK